MSILGIDRITYGVEDVAKCRKFFLDWGLKLVRESESALDFESLNGCEVHVRDMEDATLPPAIEKNVLVIPGNVFSARDTHLRISYATTDDRLAQCCEILCSLV